MLTIKRLDKQNIVVNNDLVSAIKRKNVRTEFPNVWGRYSWITIERAGQENIEVTTMEISVKEHESLLDDFDHVLQEVNIENEERKLRAVAAEEDNRRRIKLRQERRLREEKERSLSNAIAKEREKEVDKRNKFRTEKLAYETESEKTKRLECELNETKEYLKLKLEEKTKQVNEKHCSDKHYEELINKRAYYKKVKAFEAKLYHNLKIAESRLNEWEKNPGWVARIKLCRKYRLSDKKKRGK